MKYRSKSRERLVAEIDYIVERHHPRLLFATDTILDTDYFKNVLPALRARYPAVKFAYEIKAPVRREQVAALAEASITHVTVGIESLSTRLLKLLDKGTTFLKNVLCLRLAQEFGIHVGWQYLYGLPDEQIEDYTTVTDSMYLLHHLPPPMQACPITLARFSPYFDRAKENYVASIRAQRDYYMSYSWAEEDLSRVAYHFEFEFADGRSKNLEDDIQSVLDLSIATWRHRHAQACLNMYSGLHVAWIVDTRLHAPRVYLLEGLPKRILECLDADVTVEGIASIISTDEEADCALSGLFGLLDERDDYEYRAAEAEARRHGVEVMRLFEITASAMNTTCTLKARIERLLHEFRAHGLALHENGRWLGLAIPRGRSGRCSEVSGTSGMVAGVTSSGGA